MDRRGFIASSVVDFWAIVAFVIIVIVFFLVFRLGSGHTMEAKIGSRMQETNDDLVLLNLLRTPVDIDDTNITVAELIIGHHLDGSYKDEMRDTIKSILDSYEISEEYHVPRSYRLEIDGMTIFSSNYGERSSWNLFSRKEQAETLIPSPQGAITVRLESI